MNDKTVNALHEWIAANDIQSGLIFANESGQIRHGRMKIWDRFIKSVRLRILESMTCATTMHHDW